MTKLPNGCSYSNFLVYPANWAKPGASTKTKWRIYYRFYDGNGQHKQVAIKGMNRQETVEGRRLNTKLLIKKEKQILDEGFNPITGKFTSSGAVISEVHEVTPLFTALRYAIPLQDCIEKTRKNISQYVEIMALCGSGLNDMPVAAIRPKHVLLLLRTIAQKKQLSAVNYNHYRAYLMMLFKSLVPLGAIDINPVRDIPKRKQIKTQKKTLNADQRMAVKNLFSQPQHTNFYRYIQIFFASGARSTELLNLKAKDVDLSAQRYKCTIRKGRQWEEVYKTITSDVLQQWQDLLAMATHHDHYIFSVGLLPGKKSISPNQITRRWRKYVKNKETGLGIDCDFYSLKHLRTGEVVDLLDTKAAQQMNSHKSEAMVLQIYDTGKSVRDHNRLKSINNPF